MTKRTTAEGELNGAQVPQGNDGGETLNDNGPWRSTAADRTHWRDDAACRHADPELFFPVGTAGPALRQIGQAKRICQACPVRTPCLGWALNHGLELGICRGATEEERRALRAPAQRVRRSRVLTRPRAGAEPSTVRPYSVISRRRLADTSVPAGPIGVGCLGHRLPAQRARVTTGPPRRRLRKAGRHGGRC